MSKKQEKPKYTEDQFKKDVNAINSFAHEEATGFLKEQNRVDVAIEKVKDKVSTTVLAGSDNKIAEKLLTLNQLWLCLDQRINVTYQKSEAMKNEKAMKFFKDNPDKDPRKQDKPSSLYLPKKNAPPQKIQT